MRKELHLTMYDTNNCWYTNVCDKFGTEDCCWKCKRMQQTKFLLDLSNLRPIHARPLHLDLEGLNQDCVNYINGIFYNVSYFVQNGYNAYFYGPTGTGKTSWSCKILKTYFGEIAESTNFTCRGLFISVPMLLLNIKRNIKPSTYIEDFDELLNDIQKVDLVIWDDIIQTSPTDFESQWLYTLINERLLRKKANIFTSNLAPSDLLKADKRLYSRICTSADCVCFDCKDKRNERKFSDVITEFLAENPNGYDNMFGEVSDSNESEIITDTNEEDTTN